MPDVGLGRDEDPGGRDRVAVGVELAVTRRGRNVDGPVAGATHVRFAAFLDALKGAGIGLGVISSGARRVTNEMFVAAARTLASFSPALKDAAAPLYPALEGVRKLSREVALAVAGEAQRLGLAEATSREELERRIDAKIWVPRYLRYVRRRS